MIDKDKLIEACEMIDEDSKECTSILTREQIDWLCENQEKFCGAIAKPYEIKIDFGPLVIDMMANVTEVRQRVETLEILARAAIQPEIVESRPREKDPTAKGSAKSS